MATLVAISGLPGTGKTYGSRTLDPKTNFVVDSDGKGLSWAGWKKDYSVEKANYYKTADTPTILSIATKISNTKPDVKTLCIFGINSIMSKREMRERKRAGFDKWADLAGEIFDLFQELANLRDDLIVFVEVHTEPYEVEGETFWRMKTTGQKLTKLNMNGYLNYNLYTHVEHPDPGKTGEYYFITQSNGKTEARSAAGVLEYKMPNDLEEVRKRITESES